MTFYLDIQFVIQDCAEHAGRCSKQHAMSDPVLRPGDGPKQEHVSRSFRRGRNQNRLPDGRLVQETSSLRTPLWPSLHVQGKDQLWLDGGHS